MQDILLHTVVADMKRKGITPLYLITDLTDFYENMDGNFSVWFRVRKILNRSECIFTDEEVGNRKVSCFLNLCPPVLVTA